MSKASTMTKAKERPILFSAPMVRALLAGTKTQTRRIVKPQPLWQPAKSMRSEGWSWRTEEDKPPKLGAWPDALTFASAMPAYCPYGKPGDCLWARETWEIFSQQFEGQGTGFYLGYTADNSHVELGYDGHTPAAKDCFWYSKYAGKGGRPSIHMPRKFSRITLEITDVRVQRLQGISEEDAKAEGVEASKTVEMNDGSPCYSSPFQRLWLSINGVDNPASWEANPWVWALTFKRIAP